MLIIIVDIIFILVTYFFWKEYGKDSKFKTTKLESYPPIDLNSAEVGQIYKGYADEAAIVSLVLDLANKGYLKIEKIKEEINTGGNKKLSRSFKILKLKEYNGTNKNEQIFFNELFSNSNKITWNDLYDDFFIKLDKIKNLYQQNEENIYEEDSLKHSLLVLGIILILFIVCIFSSSVTIESIKILSFILPLLLPLIYFIYSVNTIPKKIFLILLEIPLLFLCFLEGLSNNIFATICNIFTIAILSFFWGIMRKKTEYSTEVSKKIIGFKKFLNKANELELQKLTDDNPEYFYIVLPYACALGIDNKLIKKFDSIDLQAPAWFTGNIEYETPKINRDIQITYEQIYVAMITKLQQFN